MPSKERKSFEADAGSSRMADDYYFEDSAVPEPTKNISDKQASARVAIFKKRNAEADLIVKSALDASVECENTPEAQRLSRPLNNNAAICGLKSVINGEERCLEMKLDDFFHIDNLLEYAQAQDVIVMNSYQFLTAHDTRQAYFDEAGNCVYCVEHSTPTHSVDSECPHMHCKCTDQLLEKAQMLLEIKDVQRALLSCDWKLTVQTVGSLARIECDENMSKSNKGTRTFKIGCFKLWKEICHIQCSHRSPEVKMSDMIVS
ncbi:hypothetical protein Ddc_08642 [Ditylenchus destructor]|nr:hypothetical protein Ddc_08642 [Ditylenchus destructor]